MPERGVDKCLSELDFTEVKSQHLYIRSSLREISPVVQQQFQRFFHLSNSFPFKRQVFLYKLPLCVEFVNNMKKTLIKKI